MVKTKFQVAAESPGCMQKFLRSLLGDDDHQNAKQNIESSENTKSSEARGKWGSKLEFILSCLGYAVGLGNVWRFPWMTWRNGGGAFLIPYLITLAFAGLPIFFMEVSLGQYGGVGPNKLFELAPLFKGLGVGMIAVSFFTSLYYNAIIMWSLYYMFSSFQAQLPWSGCNNEWNTDKCYNYDEAQSCEKLSNGSDSGAVYLFRQCYNSTVVTLNETLAELGNMTVLDMQKGLKDGDKVSAAEEYFHQKLYALNYRNSDGSVSDEIRPIEDIGLPKWDITLTLFLSWIIVYLCVLKGIKTSGKVVYFTATFPYVVLVILLIFGATLDGAATGVEYYLKPNFTKLMEPQIWGDAAGQVFFSLSVGMGGLMTYASYNEFNNNILRDTLIVTIGNSLTSLIAGFPIFSILGFMAHELNTTIDKVADSGSGLAFIAYPEVVTKMPAPPFWSIIFFFMLLTLGLDSQFAGVEVMMTAIMDSRPKLSKFKPVISGLLCAILFIATINMSCDAGIYWEELISLYSGWSLVLVGLAEVVVYGWIYGADRILRNIEEMIGWRFHVCGRIYWLVLWKVITPVLLLGIVIFNFLQTSKAKYGDYVFPEWAQTIGWLVAVTPIALIPIYSVLVVTYDYMCNSNSEETFIQRLRRLLRPSDKWRSSKERYGDIELEDATNETENGVSHSGVENKAFDGPEAATQAGI